MHKLKAIYGNNSERRISLLIFIVFFAVNAVISLFMSSMTMESEFSGPASAAGFLGRDWFDIMPSVSSVFSGLIQGILYLPSMLICSEPLMQYKLFLIMNSALFALIPLAAFRITAKAGIEKMRQRIVACAVCGIYPGVILYSHFIAGEALSAVFVWLLILILFSNVTENSKKKTGRFFLSILAGLTAAGAFFMSMSCISVFFTVCIFLIYLRFVHKKRPLYISVFAVTFIILAAADMVLTLSAENAEIFSFNGPFHETVISCIAAIAEEPQQLWLLICGRLYYFITSSWGLGITAIVFMIFASLSYYRARRKNTEQKYSEEFVTGSIFCTVLAVLTVPADAFLSAGSKLTSISGVISSEPVFAAVIPLVFLVFIFLFKYGISYIQLMAAISAVGFAAFPSLMAVSRFISTSNLPVSALQSGELAALRIGSAADAPLTGETIMYPICLIFTAFAIIIPVVCCTKKHTAKITAYICAGLMTYSAVFTCAVPLLSFAGQGGEYFSAAAVINNCIEAYSQSKSENEPTVIAVYNADKMLAMELQYSRQSSRVEYVDSLNDIPESCFVISKGTAYSGGLCVLIGRTDNINIYAIGGNAVISDAPQNDTSVLPE